MTTEVPPENADLVEPDVDAIRAYSADPCLADTLPLALFMLLLALVPFAVDEPSTVHVTSGVILLVAGFGMIAYALYRRMTPGSPMYILSPQGLTLTLSKGRQIRIPWSSVSALGRADAKMFYPSLVIPRTIKFKDVTTVVVPRTFYNAHIHVDSLFMRGPGWNLHFIPNNDTVGIAIHHEAIGEPKEKLRREIDARWQKFRSDTVPGIVPRVPQRLTARPKQCSVATSGWANLLAIAVLAPAIVVLFTNIVGIWETENQQRSREEKLAWRKKIEDSDRKAAEDGRQRDEFWKDFWQKSGGYPRTR